MCRGEAPVKRPVSAIRSRLQVVGYLPIRELLGVSLKYDDCALVIIRRQSAWDKRPLIQMWYSTHRCEHSIEALAAPAVTLELTTSNRADPPGPLMSPAT